VGEHDNALLTGDDDHQDIQDDGRSLFGEGFVNPQAVYSSPDLKRLAWSMKPWNVDPDAFASAMDDDEHNFLKMFIYKGSTLIPDFILHPDASKFEATEWERSYSRIVKRTASHDTFLGWDGSAPFFPVTEEVYGTRRLSYRVVAHWGLVSGVNLFVPIDTVGHESGVESVKNPHLPDYDEALKQYSAEQLADRNFVDRHLVYSYSKMETINAFLGGGGLAVVKAWAGMEPKIGGKEEYFLPKDYTCEVLVRPDGELLSVLKIKWDPPDLSTPGVWDVIKLAFDAWLVIDLGFIFVDLLRLSGVGIKALCVFVKDEAGGALRQIGGIAGRSATRALDLAKREAKAALDLAKLEARAVPEAVGVEGRSASRSLFQKQRAVALEQTAAAKEAEAVATEGKIATAGSAERAQRLRAQAESLRGEAARLRREAAEFRSGAKSATADLPTPEEIEKELDKIALGDGKPQKAFSVPLATAERTPQAIARLERTLQSTARGRVVFRVEGGGSMPRLSLDAAGNVTTGSGTLNLNFGSLERALEFLEKRGPGARIISFEVDETWVQSVRSAAMPEHMTGALGRDIRLVDVSYADDQMQIPEKLLHEMEKFIVPGSGKVLLVK
jgi:hypothetical protein